VIIGPVNEGLCKYSQKARAIHIGYGIDIPGFGGRSIFF
jgi:hypothetical protein